MNPKECKSYGKSGEREKETESHVHVEPLKKAEKAVDSQKKRSKKQRGVEKCVVSLIGHDVRDVLRCLSLR